MKRIVKRIENALVNMCVKYARRHGCVVMGQAEKLEWKRSYYRQENEYLRWRQETEKELRLRGFLDNVARDLFPAVKEYTVPGGDPKEVFMSLEVYLTHEDAKKVKEMNMRNEMRLK